VSTSRSPALSGETRESESDSTGNSVISIAPEMLETHSRLQWQQQQERYWSEISVHYDDLYQSRWSKLENEWVTRRLGFVRSLVSPDVVDLGCGTGLGLDLLRQINPSVRYTGVDISAAMMRLAADSDADTKTLVGAMDDLSALDNASADVVVALFSSASFAYRTSSIMSEIARVLRPRGHAYLSALSATALSRTIRCAGRDGMYRTRGDRRDSIGVPVHRLTTVEIRKLAAVAGLATISVVGMNTLSGVLEFSPLWGAGRLLARLIPASAHTIEVHMRKLGSC
jgi:SAM-dependent methyltransferase